MKPKILTTLPEYTRSLLVQDVIAGVTVAMVALPLSLAIAIASGADPAKGLVTAIVAGFLISLLGGSRVQVGGPTGAFIVVVFSVIAEHGYDGLVLATFMAGLILLVAGYFRAGNLIRLIPEPVINGFTIGIAFIIATSQLKDLLGLGLLVDRETASRETKRFESRMRTAKLRHLGASPEDIDYRSRRNLDKALFQQLLTGKWIKDRRNLMITGPCGVGKTWLACALAQSACRTGTTVLYKRLPRLFDELELAHGDGRFPRLFRGLTKTDLLILDDWGPDRLNASQRRDLMEIVEDRYEAGSILITSQLPVDAWHDVIGEPTFADAILDRLVHNAYRIGLDGQSMRKTKVKIGDETQNN